MHVSVKNLTKRFGEQAAVNEVSFDIGEGKLIGLLGPSGGGKTTVLRLLAGLEHPDAGDIFIHGERVNDTAPQARGIGFVFQNYALFRHMSVYDNIAFGLNVQKKNTAAIKTRVEELIRLTGLSGLGGRLPHQLSGGQRQRVAFARAIAPNPRLLLLDEPFAAIDAKVRKELRSWLKDMIEQVGITTIFVTHDQEEAVEVADEIMIISQGRVEQKGTPWEIYKHPQTPFVASFIGESNVLDGVFSLKGFFSGANGLKVMIRPEFIDITKPEETAYPSAVQKAIVRKLYFRGTAWQVEVESEGYRLSAYRSLEEPALQVGEAVDILIHRIYLFEGESGSMLENTAKFDPMPVYI